MKAVLTQDALATHSLCVVEIVGLAGAGKTTLTRALSQRNPKIEIGVPLSKLELLPFFIWHTRQWLPAYLRDYRKTRWFTWKETRAMMYLEAWHHQLSRLAHPNESVTILDSGPIFRLTRLHEFGPQIIHSQVYGRWWNTQLQQWAATLDLVIWLEAPHPVLTERIETRSQRHRIKGKGESQTHEFLVDYAAAYERVLSVIKAHGGPPVLRFDTQAESASQIAEKVLAAIASVAG